MHLIVKNFMRKKVSDTLIEINHCNKGRFECELEPGMLNYLGEGDLVTSIAYHQNKYHRLH